MKIKLISIGVFSLTAITAGAGTLNVPADYDTVENAVAAAQSGDEVVIAASATPYAMTNAISVASGVTVRGASGGWKGVTLDFTAVANKRAVTLQAGGALASVTVSGGNYKGSGAGVYLAGSVAIVNNCRVTACKSGSSGPWGGDFSGGAIGNNGGVVTNCVIDGNGRYDTTTQGNGCIGYQSFASTAVMDGCVITNNVDAYGQLTGTIARDGVISGMVRLNAGVLRRTLIADNDVGPQIASRHGTYPYGFALGVAANATVENCTIVRNRYTGSDRSDLFGVVAMNQKTIAFRNNVIADNRAWGAETSHDASLGAAVVTENNYTDCLYDLGAGDVSLPASQIAAIGCFPSNTTGLACSFSASDRTPFPGETILLNANVAEAPGAIAYAWDLDGDGVWDVDHTTVNVPFTPTATGRRWVGLKVTSGNAVATFRGAIDVRQKTFWVDAASADPTAPYATASTAARTIAEALALARGVENAEVRVKPETYALTARLSVDHGNKIVGDAADRETVVLSGPSNARSVSLAGCGATLANVKVTGGRGVETQYGSVVTNCRVTASVQGVGGRGLGIFNDGSSVLDSVIDGIVGATSTSGAYYQSGSVALMNRCVISNCNNTASGWSGSYPTCSGAQVAGGEIRNSLIADVRSTWGSHCYTGGGALVVNSGAKFVNGAVLDCTITSSASNGHAVNVDAGGVLLNSILNGNTRNTAADDTYGDGTYTNSFISSVTETQAANGCVALKGDEYVRVPGGLYTVPDTSALIDKGADTDWMTEGVDLAGNPRCVNDRLDVGAIENQKEKAAFWCRIDTEKTSALGRLSTTLAAYQEGAAGDVTYYWDLDGDGEYEITNRTSVVYDSSTVGTVTVSLKAEDGVSTPATYALDLTVLQGVYYVDANGTNPVAPYDTPEKAATNVADAVAIMNEGAEVRLAAGEYALTNTVALVGGSRLVGAGATRADVVVRGGGGRLFTLTGAGTTLANLTLTKLPTTTYVAEGGALYANAGTVVTNCHVTNPGVVFSINNNWSVSGYAVYSADALVVDCEFSDISVNQHVYGYAIYQTGDNALTERCVFRNLTAKWWGYGPSYPCCMGVAVKGGRVRDSLFTDCTIDTALAKSGYNLGALIQNAGRVENCTVVGNVLGTGYSTAACSNCTAAVSGAGVFENCLVYDNLTLGEQKNWNLAYGTGTQDYRYCCTTTNGLAGAGNVPATPGCYKKRANGRVFANAASPCYNAGTNLAWMAGATDLYGNPRILHDRVDIGAAEYPAPGLMLLVK